MSWFLKGFKLSQVFLNILSTYRFLKGFKLSQVFLNILSHSATASSYVFSITVTSNQLVTFLSN